MINKTMMGSMDKRSVNKGSTLRMPAKFSYMTEEEAEYGGGCWEWVLTIFGGACLLGGGACFAAHFIWNVGDRKTMVITGAALCAVGAVCLVFGIKGLTHKTPPIQYIVVDDEESIGGGGRNDSYEKLRRSRASTVGDCAHLFHWD